MPAFMNDLFSVGVSGQYEGVNLNVIYTQPVSPGGTTIIPPTTPGGTPTIVQSALQQWGTLLLLLLAVIAVIWIAK